MLTCCTVPMVTPDHHQAVPVILPSLPTITDCSQSRKPKALLCLWCVSRFIYIRCGITLQCSKPGQTFYFPQKLWLNILLQTMSAFYMEFHMWGWELKIYLYSQVNLLTFGTKCAITPHRKKRQTEEIICENIK